ncbi:MAG: transcriptional regulator, partial [Candidatus Kariarchaeaceae archaeon]
MEFTRIETKLHSLPRMSILEHLIKNTNISFSELLEITQLSPGNLYSHCQILENSGYIIKNKIISGDRP